ncbi:MAG: sigma 54-interacting transcriptional regulator [Bacteroidales bacterium]|nr:sigma 54-interacting transcriptional regulator [Bacteroidales bacterium]
MENEEIQRIKQRFGIIGSDAGLMRAIATALQVAQTDLSVLITGESGVGKEVFPQIIHQHSIRKHGAYIAVNCGAIPEGTIDSELFGHEKGAFTGATESRKGYFEVADGGTIFLDEVGELPLSTQVRLLRVLETGEYLRVGSSKIMKTDVRVVAATNLDVPDAVAKGKFREDLYYRLNTVPIAIPPLRARQDDIALLFRKFAVDFAAKYRMPAVQLTDDARQVLLSYNWPGNIRQLRNITEQISIIETDRTITAEVLRRYLPDYVAQKLPARLSVTSDEHTFASEREILYSVLFDLRKDVNDLKRMMKEMGHGDMRPVEPATTPYEILQSIAAPQPPSPDETQQFTVVASPPVSVITSADQPGQKNRGHVEDTEAIQEESLSLNAHEIEMIRKALEKHRGKRKDAARELGISERTLYRKIKEHHLE